MNCSKCGSNENPFPKVGRKCKPCVNQKIYEYRNKKWQSTIEYIRSAKSVPCADCDQTYPYYVMDFDHLGNKKFIVSRFKTEYRSYQEVVDEIAKCDVVCANCHRIRTFTRNGL